MRILRVISSMDPAMGGPCQGIRNSAPALEQLGCQNEIVCLDDPDADFLVDETLTIHAIGQSKGPWASHPELIPWLESNLERYDVVIVHGLWQYPSYAVTKVMRQLRSKRSDDALPRLFVMPHGMLDPWFQQDTSRRVKAWRNWAYWKLLEHRTIAEADGLLFTCQKELELARQPFRPYAPQQDLNVGYGVAEPPSQTPEMAAAFRSTCPQLGERPYVLFLSRIHPKKGVDLLINAFASVVAERKGRGLPSPALVIAGPLDSDYARQMQTLATEQMKAHRESEGDPHQSLQILFPGMLQGDAKWGAFYQCDAFVLPSHQENFGIAVVEALACGKPVLISDQVNICDEIEAAEAGLISQDNEASVGTMLQRWLNTSDKRRSEMSSVAKTCYVKNFLPMTAAHRFFEAIS